MISHPNTSLSRSKTALTIFFVLALFLSACAQAASTPQYDYESAPEAPAEEPAGGEGSRGLANSTQAIQRIVIKNARLEIVVPDPADAMDQIVAMAEEMGGYVVSARLDQTRLDSGAEVPSARTTVRIPAERLDEALDRIGALSDRDPLYENIESQDVTSDYVDLQSRLRNLENAEKQLTTIMEQATKTEDVLNVYNQIVSTREQIEVIKGQIQYYEESAALSSVEVNLLVNEAVQPLTIGSWQPEGVARSAIQALINTVKFLVNALIWIVIYLLPVLLLLYLVIILPLSLLWKAWRRRRARAASVPNRPAPPAPPQAT